MNKFSKYTSKKTFSRIVDYPSVSAMWEHSVSTFKNNVAIIDGDIRVTYSELDNEVSHLRALINEKGLKKGDFIGIFMDNCIAFARTYLAITTIGAIAVLLPPSLDENKVFGIAYKYGLKALFYGENLKEKLNVLKNKNANFLLISESESSADTLEITHPDSKDGCTVIFTSGTNGNNKAVLLSNRAVMEGTKNGCYGTYDVFEQKYFLILPLTHVFGLIRNLLVNLYTGSTLWLCQNKVKMFNEIAEFQPTVIVLVPALAEMALNLTSQFHKNMLGDSLKTIICGSATVPQHLVVEYDKLGISLLPGYGLTESANLVSGNPDPLHHPNSVGYVYDGIETKVVDDELWIKGPTIMDCYVNDPEENKNSFEDGWFKTGDLVSFDDDGMLHIIGRKKELIILSNGENISPAEIEETFLGLDVIQDCLVYEGKNELSDRLVLEVLPRKVVLDTIECDNKEEYILNLLKEVNHTLPSHKKITKFIIRDKDFIRSPSMKIVRSKNG